MGNCSIRPVLLTEAGTLAELARRTFIATFASDNDPDDLEGYLDRAFGIEQMSSELRRPHSWFFFAEVAGKPAGYLKINTGDAQTERAEGKTLEIERIYVDAEWQGHGLGKALLEFSIDEAKRRRSDAVWLGVWENNAKAISFYEREGFVPFGRHDFVIGNDVQTDILMRCALT